MMMLPCLAIATLLLFRVSLAQNDPPKLELASVVFRHGDRSPVGRFPTDKYFESDWPQGYGQLSVTGMTQQYQLGKILRDRYIYMNPGFLNENYTRVQVYVRSTDVDRTLMSAGAQLSGLFPPVNSDQQFNHTIDWQPIPVHTVPADQDLLLRAHNTNCPAYTRLREADETTQEYIQLENDNQEFFKYLAEKTGLETVNLSYVWHLQDTLYIENVTEGKEPPSWLTTQNLTRLNELADFTMELMFNGREKKRITAGNWLQKVLSDMKGKANGTLNESKLFLYSAHDTTVAPMMNALGVWNGKQPSYATAFFIELYSRGKSEYFVKLYWRDGPDSSTVEQLNASSTLTLQDFENFVTPLIPTDWIKECDIPTTDPTVIAKSASQGIVALGVLFSVSIIALIVVSIVLGLVCYEKGPRYQRLSSGVDVSAKQA